MQALAHPINTTASSNGRRVQKAVKTGKVRGIGTRSSCSGHTQYGVAGTTIDPENSKKCRGAAENPAPGRVRWAQALESVVRMLARQRVGGVDIRHLFFKWCPILWGQCPAAWAGTNSAGESHPYRAWPPGTRRKRLAWMGDRQPGYVERPALRSCCFFTPFPPLRSY